MQPSTAAQLVTYELSNKDAITRKIRVKPEEDGTHFLLEVVDTSLVSPEISWTRFDSRRDAETTAKAQYDESLKEGFVPVDPPEGNAFER